MSFKRSRACGAEKSLSTEEQQTKINEVRKMIGPVANKLPVLCSDASISRYLRARNWNTKKASKMLVESLKWRLDYKPEKIVWEDVAREAETGKVYKANSCDKFGRPVLVMRPGYQNTSSTEGQIKYLVYCMENALMGLTPEKEQIVWLIDFQRWTMSSISVKVTRETINLLQNHYPERLGLAILYNPPKVFESFWTIVKPFIEPKTYKKVRFANSSDPQSQRIMEALFDMDKLDSALGGKSTVGFDYEAYAKRMREDDKKKSDLMNTGCSSPISRPLVTPQLSQSESLALDRYSEDSDEDELPSADNKTASNLETVDGRLVGPTLSCEDIPKSEATAAEGAQRLYDSSYKS